VQVVRVKREPVPKAEIPEQIFFTFFVDKVKRFSYNACINAGISKKQEKKG
jgi:hypothetical protein